MKKAWVVIATLATMLWAGGAAGEDLTSLQGAWEGPWYIGMSSGKAAVDIAPDGAGKISLTNLEGFGDAPVALTKVEFDGKNFRFSAVGEAGAEFRVKMQLGGDGTKLRGNGKYGGFGARLELQRVR